MATSTRRHATAYTVHRTMSIRADVSFAGRSAATGAPWFDAAAPPLTNDAVREITTDAARDPDTDADGDSGIDADAVRDISVSRSHINIISSPRTSQEHTAARE